MAVLTRLILRGLWRPLVLAAVALGVVALPASALADGGHSAVGHVYLDDNTAGVNTVGAFDRHADGSLTPLPGSPFSVGGAGAGKGLASQGAAQLADHGRYLLVVDNGSNQISVLRVSHDGSLRPVEGSPVSSGGLQPVSIAVHDGLVYVANAGDPDSNYSGFTLSRGGQLRPLAASTVPLPVGSQPGDVLFNATGTKLVGTRVNSSLIDSFAVNSDGRLTAAPGSPYPAQGVGPFGSEFRPTNPSQLFVTNAHNGTAPNGTGLGTVSAFNDSGNGTLTSIGGSPFADQQTAPCWTIITPDGQHLFAVNTGSGTISRYSIASGGQLTLLGSTPVSATGGVGAVDPGLTPDGHTLYINESRIDAVGEFAVNGGDLTELAGSPVALPAGATPAGIAVK
jgi:6-phosphogluconolactonase